jgi:hypothetical protein
MSAQEIARRFNSRSASLELTRLLPTEKAKPCLGELEARRPWTEKKVYNETYAAMQRLKDSRPVLMP